MNRLNESQSRKFDVTNVQSLISILPFCPLVKKFLTIKFYFIFFNKFDFVFNKKIHIKMHLLYNEYQKGHLNIDRTL